MNKQKLSLAAIQDKLSRNEMKQIMAGLEFVDPVNENCNIWCKTSSDCTVRTGPCTKCGEDFGWGRGVCERPV